MTPDWTLDIDGRTYHPIPESWLAHPSALDRDNCAGPRLFAVSAATIGSKTVRVRYAQPRTGQVLVCQTAGETPAWADGVVPRALVTGYGWPRSLRPGRSDPADTIRAREEEHLTTLWQDRVEFVETGETIADVVDEPVATDGGEES